MERTEAESSTSGDASNHVAGLVLARGGSRGILRKNVRLLAGQPLISWVLRPMRDLLSSLWVSTDDNEIAQISMKYNANIHYRDSSTAADSCSSIMAVQDFLSLHPGKNTKALNFDPRNRPRRQDWSGELVESGHFYAARVSLIQEGLLQGKRCGYIEMPKEMCIEIDSEHEWIMAEQLVKLYGYKQS